MERGQQKHSARSLKSGKKDGKAVKAQAGAEEAKRREMVRETLREKLELEKRALQVVERLLEEDGVAEDFLVDCARLITVANYKDTIEERCIAKLCGYPVCSNNLGKIPMQQYKISTKTNKVYDITERKCFCSNFCYKASKAFELQIPNIPLWLRPHESLPDVTLMKKGDGGSTGEEVLLAERRLREEDIENPLPPADPVAPEAPSGPRRSPLGLSHSDSSDGEQDFVSSVVSQQSGPRVHWGKLPKHKGESHEDGESSGEREKGQTLEESENLKTERHPTAGPDQPSEQPPLLGERGSPEGQSVEEAAGLLNHCKLQNSETVTANPCVHSNTTSTQCIPQEGEGSPEPTQIPQKNLTPPPPHPQPGLDITQVGMSRKGAAGLRGLLKTGTQTDMIHQNLLERLRRTLSEWRSEETIRFLHGPDHNSCPPLPEVKMEEEKEEEELDEDDLDYVVEAEGQGCVSGPPGEQGRPSAPVPDYQTLHKQAEEQELRVKEFYRGSNVLPNEVRETGHSETLQDQGAPDPSLPLVDSHSQLLIQKGITVEKLTRSLGVVLGPLRLTMSDIFSDLTGLVRTFRFTNTNIIHKTPEWTLISVVLLHVLTEVSPLLREALESPWSVVYLSTLMDELNINAQDLQGLVQLLKSPAH